MASYVGVTLAEEAAVSVSSRQFFSLRRIVDHRPESESSA